ncbi:MAG: hypothetical protein KKI14_04320 [Nanoarchaeota archaeon]|nr:hypothetical protein [Nanoarchaeota archaeon]
MNKKQEGEILLRGMEKHYQDYTPGMLQEFTRKYKVELQLFVHFRLFARILAKSLVRNSRIKVIEQKCTLPIIKKMLKTGPIIVNLDAYYLAYGYPVEHAPHFVIVEKINDKITLVDPWDAKRKVEKIDNFKTGIQSLAKRFRYSPLMITCR